MWKELLHELSFKNYKFQNFSSSFPISKEELGRKFWAVLWGWKVICCLLFWRIPYILALVSHNSSLSMQVPSQQSSGSRDIFSFDIPQSKKYGINERRIKRRKKLEHEEGRHICDNKEFSQFEGSFVIRIYIQVCTAEGMLCWVFSSTSSSAVPDIKANRREFSYVLNCLGPGLSIEQVPYGIFQISF